MWWLVAKRVLDLSVHISRAGISTFGSNQFQGLRKNLYTPTAQVTKRQPDISRRPTHVQMASTFALPNNIDHVTIANEWFQAFAPLVERGDAVGILDLLTEDSFWRDALALTWDLRTFDGPAKIKRFLNDRLKTAKLTNLKLGNPSLVNNSPVNVWIQSIFAFNVGDYGLGTGVFRLASTPTGEWKGYTIYTSLSGLKDHPERLGEHRDKLPNHGKWLGQRQREIEFVDEEPHVLVVGGGHGGIHVAARLKHLGVPTLVVERNPRMGDNWRNRYDTLCLHDPVCKFRGSGDLFVVAVPLYCLFHRAQSVPIYTIPAYLADLRAFK